MTAEPVSTKPGWLALKRMSLAASSGLLMAVSLPLAISWLGSAELCGGGWLEPVALVGLVPLLWVLRGARPRRAFGLGTLAGAVFFLASLYWLDVAMTTFGHMPRVLSIPVLFLLVGFLSLFWGLAFWASVRCRIRLRIPVQVSLPLIWVALEFLRNYVLTGFPWAGLGTTQVRTLWLAQLSSLGGVYLVAFAVVLTNGVLEALWAWTRRRAPLPRWSAAGWAALLAFAGIYSAVRLLPFPAPGDAVRVKAAVIQGNLDEKAGLRGAAGQRWVFARMLHASKGALAEGARLVVWPEGTLPDAVDPRTRSFANLAGRSRLGSGDPPAELVVGGIARGTEQGKTKMTNSAFLVDDRFTILDRYDKRHLVPFGEYVPAARILPYQWFVPEWVVFFTPGPDHEPMESRSGRLGMLICYEAIFPEIAAESVDEGAQILVNITNDSWYGVSSAPYQHLAISRMRAIETGRYILRAANTGVSAIIDPVGRVVVQTSLGLSPAGGNRISRRDLVPPTSLVGTVALLDGKTVYGVIGDLFAWVCALAALVLVGWSFFKKTRPDPVQKAPSSEVAPDP
jgi:apolipoprotein N-acyltransferase